MSVTLVDTKISASFLLGVNIPQIQEVNSIEFYLLKIEHIMNYRKQRRYDFEDQMFQNFRLKPSKRTQLHWFY